MESIKVVSYNILSDKWAIYNKLNPATHKIKDRYSFIPDDQQESILSWSNRLPRILDKISKINPDIICLQETDLEYIKKNFIDNLPDYDYAHHIIWTDTLDKKIYKRINDIGNITFWKKNLFNCVTSSFNSCAVFTELVYNDFKFQLVNVHLMAGLNSSINTRKSQLKSCYKKLNTSSAIICGDFNDDLVTSSVVKDFLIGKKFIFAEPQPTCMIYSNGNYSFNAFDHVASRDLDVNVEKVPDECSIPSLIEPSDHFALVFYIGKKLKY